MTPDMCPVCDRLVEEELDRDWLDLTGECAQCDRDRVTKEVLRGYMESEDE